MESRELADHAIAYRVEAQALRAQGRHSEALAVYAQAIESALAIPDATLAAQVQIGRIDSLGLLGRDDEGIALGRELTQTLQAAGKIEDAARARMNVANLLRRKDLHGEALLEYEACRLIFIAGENLSLLAMVEANAANCLSYLGDFEQARERLAQARAGFEAGDQTTMAAMSEADQGYLFFLSGEHGPALTALTRAISVFQSDANLVVETAKCRADRADVYHVLNLLPEAIADYTESLAVLESVPLPYESARIYLGRAAALLAQGDSNAALVDLAQAEKLFLAQRNTLHLGRVYLLRALATGDLVQAKKAVLSFKKCGQHGWAAEAGLLLAAQSPRKLGAIIRVAKTWSRGWLAVRAWQALGDFYRQDHKLSIAIRAYRQAVDALESVQARLAAPEELHLSFLTDKAPVYNLLIDALLERGTPRARREALGVLERSRSRLVLERLAQTPTSTSATSAPSDTLLRLRRELSEAYYRLNGFPDETRRFGGVSALSDVHAREASYKTLLREEEAMGETRLVHQANATAFALSTDRFPLQMGETMVAFYSTQETLHAFVLQQGRPMRFVANLCAVSALSQAVRRFRFHLRTPQAPNQIGGEVQSVLQLLYDMLLRPLEPYLTQTKRLIIIPHGLVQGVPIHALHDGSVAVLDRFECVFNSGISLWAATRARPKTTASDSLIMGLDAPEIPAAMQEAKHVATRLPAVQLCMGNAATVAAFRTFAPQSRFLHLATHALFRRDNPQFSGLHLADGWLLARDLKDIALVADIAVLSACQTGLSKIEPGGDALGLVRAFLTSGARSVVASLWNADDTTTRVLMENFYEQFSRQSGGPRPATALRSAQQSVRAQFPHPYYWAAFQVFGS
jgi:CHAT domain-containing protein/tetratricopeptide (TPR) repeat protein